MPFTVDSVNKHRKGLTDKQKKAWVRIANRALKTCMAEGKSTEDCDGTAIRIANSVFEKEGKRVV